MAKGFPKGHWLHKAKAGELHRALGVKEGVKIPTKALMKAANAGTVPKAAAGNGEPAPASGETYGSTKDAIKASMAC